MQVSRKNEKCDAGRKGVVSAEAHLPSLILILALLSLCSLARLEALILPFPLYQL